MNATSRLLAVSCAFAGVLAMCVFLDIRMLDPTRSNWLAVGDSAQSYLGWLFFRQTPWSVPLGAVPALGMEQSSSIVYTDSIPLLAFLCKPFAHWLPQAFQYHGAWLAACYALQAYIACRLIGLFTPSRVACVIGAMLFVLSPIMLLRAQAHLALTAHWIVLAALYLYYRPVGRRGPMAWMALLWVAPLVHAYLTAMAFALWAAFLWRRWRVDSALTAVQALAWAALSVTGLLAVMLLAGYFVGSTEVSSGGFGYYSMNLLAPFTPLGAGPFGMPAVAAATDGQYEGFNYLGLGVLCGLLVVGITWLRRWRAGGGTHDTSGRRRDRPLLIVALLLAVLALSGKVTVGTHVLFDLPLPAPVAHLANVFRCSGRMFWPAYYVLLLAVIRGIARFSLTARLAWFALVLALQVWDVAPFLASSAHAAESKLAGAGFPSFPSSFWKVIATRYRALYVIPGQFSGDDYLRYQYLAGSLGMPIDTAYYARQPDASTQAPRTQRHAQFFDGVLDRHGLYLVQADALPRLRALQHAFPADTGIGAVDGFNVVAPAWGSDRRFSLHGPGQVDAADVVVGHRYVFDAGGDGLAFLGEGWSEAGPGGLWSEGRTSKLALRLPPARAYRVALELLPYLPRAFPSLRVAVSVNGTPVAQFTFVRGAPAPATVVTVLAAPGAASNRLLELRYDRPRSPHEAGESADTRAIAVNLQGLTMEASP